MNTETKQQPLDQEAARLSLYPLSIGMYYKGDSIKEIETMLRAFVDKDEFENAMAFKAGLVYLQSVNFNKLEVVDWMESMADMMEVDNGWFWRTIEKECDEYSKQAYNFKYTEDGRRKNQ